MKKALLLLIAGAGLALAALALPASGQTTYPLQLQKGWNQIGLGPYRGVLKYPSTCKVSKLLWWDGKKQGTNQTPWTYLPNFNLEPLKAYFVYTWDNTCRVEITRQGGPLETTLALNAGWNLISADASWEQMKNNCRLKNGRGSLLHLNTAAGKFEPVASLTAPLASAARFTGYFANVAAACTLKKAAPPALTPPVASPPSTAPPGGGGVPIGSGPVMSAAGGKIFIPKSNITIIEGDPTAKVWADLQGIGVNISITGPSIGVWTNTPPETGIVTDFMFVDPFGRWLSKGLGFDSGLRGTDAGIDRYFCSGVAGAPCEDRFGTELTRDLTLNDIATYLPPGAWTLYGRIRSQTPDNLQTTYGPRIRIKATFRVEGVMKAVQPYVLNVADVIAAKLAFSSLYKKYGTAPHTGVPGWTIIDQETKLYLIGNNLYATQLQLNIGPKGPNAFNPEGPYESKIVTAEKLMEAAVAAQRATTATRYQGGSLGYRAFFQTLGLSESTIAKACDFYIGKSPNTNPLGNTC